MTTKKDGGPAFPRTAAVNKEGYVSSPAFEGMSLRDWFAGMVLNNIGKYDIYPAPKIASIAYEIADAMIAERDKEKSNDSAAGKTNH